MVGRSEKIRAKKKTFQAVLRIRIRRIHMFLGFLDPDPSIIKRPDPDPLVRGMDPRIRIHTKMDPQH
jgi:hypothetical protein